jgi:hypothetical protein
MPGDIVDEFPLKIDWQRRRPSRSPTRDADVVLILPTKVQQLLSTLAS